MSKKCPCANPPGGSLDCEDDQLGICGVIDGELIVGCFDPPPNVAEYRAQGHSNVMDNWVLSRVTGIERSPRQAITYPERQILQTGRFIHPTTGETVRFSAPKEDEEPIPQASPISRYR